ncbi:hypothetical protein JCM19037_4773 [Geomicrobium sp. JCM 19037]|nr:hypothetical protein JCM19037_4773 [Geomicrobium sp. JCM 19037]
MQDIRPLLASLPGLGLFSQTFGWVSFTYGASVISIEALGAAGLLNFLSAKGRTLRSLLYSRFSSTDFLTGSALQQ